MTSSIAPIQALLGPIIGFCFTVATIVFIGLTARRTEEREDLAPLQVPGPPPPPAAGSEPPAPPVAPL